MSISTGTSAVAAALDTARQDTRLALRMMRRSPGITSIIVLTLALGIGANAAIFGVVNSLLLRPLPVDHPERLVTISSDAALARGFPSGFGWSFAMWEALQPHAARVGGLLAWTPTRFDLAAGGERQPVQGIFASGSYFTTLGVTAVRGRVFTTADDEPGGGPDGPVAVISSGLWQRRFAGADNVIGASLLVDGVTVTIIGVVPPEFVGVDVGRPFDVALPLAAEPIIHGARSTLRTSPLLVMLRLKPDQTAAAGTAMIRGLQPELLGVSPEGMATVQPEHLREPFTLVPAPTGTSLPVWNGVGLRQSYTRPLFTILAVAVLVLLIACVNIANLLLARSTARRHELGVRLALGASRGQLVRQLLIESLALAGLGACGGLLAARWSAALLVAALSTPADRVVMDLSFDWRVLAFTAVVALATAIVFGIAPALSQTRIAPMDALKAQRRGVTPQDGRGRGVPTLSGGLAIGQVALSVTLVIVAALLVASFERLSRVPLGFDPHRVLVVTIDAGRARTPLPDRLRLYRDIVDTVGRVPGVANAGASVWTPLDGGMRMANPRTHVNFHFITPGWLATYGVSVRAGRDFTARDAVDTTPVAIVNRSYVRTMTPGRVPLGETIPSPGSRGARRTVVGVVEDMVFESQREGTRAIVYLPVAQSAGTAPAKASEFSIGVRPAAGDPMRLARSVADALRAVDPGLSFSFNTLTANVQASIRQERLVATLSGVFGALALSVAALGLYGVTSSAVSRRTSEIGIRRALGAETAHVLGLVIGRCLTLTVAGIGVGLAAAAAITRHLRGMLFDLTPLDPTTFAGVAMLFIVVSLVAAVLPARRATHVDPLVVLRSE